MRKFDLVSLNVLSGSHIRWPTVDPEVVEQEKRRSQRIKGFSSPILQRNPGIRWGQYPFFLFHECNVSYKSVELISHCTVMLNLYVLQC